MRVTVLAGCLVLGLAVGVGFAGPAVPRGKADTKVAPPKELTLEEALARACGVALVEVTESKEKDYRPGDGNLVEEITLKNVRASGETLRNITITKALGGHRAPGPAQPDPLHPSPFRKGKQYWIVWASSHDVYAHRILKWWPAEDAAAPARELDAAVKADRYAWHPRYYPAADLTYGRKVDRANKQTTLRMSRGSQVLWEKTLAGTPTERYNAWSLYPKKDMVELSDVDAEDAALFVVAELERSLDKENPYGQPPGQYYLRYLFAAETSKAAIVQIFRPQAANVELGFNRYSLKSEKLVYQMVNTYRESGGKAVGAEKEQWWEQVQRRFDEKGKVETKRFRLAGSRMEPVEIGARGK